MFLRLLTSVVLLFVVAVCSAASDRPNIIVILADDMGFSDIGCYGSEIQTPNIDQLAKSGVRFSQFYNGARCCPSRAALLTGLYAHQAGIGHMVDNYAKGVREKLNSPAYTTQLNDRCVTIAEALGAAGYETMISGKWHVGNEREAWPDRRGFTRSFALVSGAMNYFGRGPEHAKNVQLVLDGELWTERPAGFYSTDEFSNRAVQFIRERKDPEKPFFLYLAYTAPHWPLQALPEDIAKYRGKYRDGFGKVRKARLDRQIESGLFPKGTQLPPRDEAVKPWHLLTDIERDEWDLRMAIYAAQVDRMDQGIGKLMAALKANGAAENTLVLFLSDNGACHEVQNGGKPGAELGSAETYSSYRRAWAQVSNTPFRFYKTWVHEGGIATPLVMNWPAQIQPRAEFVRETGHLIDIMATALDAAKVDYPKSYRDREITPPAGTSLLAAVRGEKLVRKEALCWEHEGNRAVRDGQWKLVSRFGFPWELYDLGNDRTESLDLASQQPDRVRALAAAYDVWAERCNVRPWELTKAK